MTVLFALHLASCNSEDRGTEVGGGGGADGGEGAAGSGALGSGGSSSGGNAGSVGSGGGVGAGGSVFSWSEEQKLTPGNGALSLASVAVSGNTAVVGSYEDDFNGAAYVFVRSGSTWIQQQKLTASDAEQKDRFGWSVAVNGDTAVVGAIFDDDGQTDSGSAYVFGRSGTTWMEQQKLTAKDGTWMDGFGHSVAVSSDTVVVGVANDDEAGGQSGSAYVFVRSGTTWTEQQKLGASDGGSLTLFGQSVAVSGDGDTVIVGAPGHAYGSGKPGAVYVFVRSGSTWAEQQKLTPKNAAGGDFFGESVSLSRDTIIASANGDGHAGAKSGAAYVFTRPGPNMSFSEQQKLTASDAAGDAWFGTSVSVSGDMAVVGAFKDNAVGKESGAAYMFLRSGTTWTEQHKLTASDATAGGWFGWSVSMSSATALVGANPYGGSAAAYVYRLSP